MSKEEEKNKLIEELGVHLENQHDIPPLAARIYASLIVTDQEGLSFDQCQMSRCASKSSISTAINLLLKLGLISYFTKPGDRKRYFRTNTASGFYIKKLEEKLKTIELENKVISKIRIYNATYNPDKYKINKEWGDIYYNFIIECENLLAKTLKDLKKIDNHN